MDRGEYEIHRAIIHDLWDLSWQDMEQLALRARVSPSTLYAWREGHTLCPRLDTLTKVSRELGYSIKLEVA